MLQTLRSIQIEEEKEERRVSSSVDDSSCSHTFNVDSFSPQILQKSYFHVFHLLFTCLDGKEADKRFRDAWPVDKKIESCFRRIVKGWLEEIISQNPKFFVGVKLEVLGGILVQINGSSGERLLHLLECLTIFVLDTVIRRNGLPIGCAKLTKPRFFGDSGITTRQVALLKIETSLLLINNIAVRKRYLKISIEVKKRFSTMTARRQLYQEEHKNLTRTVENGLKSLTNSGTYEYFLKSGTSDANYFVSKLKPLFGNATVPKDSLLKNSCIKEMEQVLNGLAQGISDKSRAFYSLFKAYNRLWYILSMDNFEERTLDVDGLFVGGETSTRSFAEFVIALKETVTLALQDLTLQRAVNPKLLAEYKKLNMQFQYLKILNTQTREKFVGAMKKFLNFDFNLNAINDQKEQLRGVNWSSISRIMAHRPQSFVSFSPPAKNLEFVSETGFTPVVVNFLQFRNTTTTEIGNYRSVRCQKNVIEQYRETSYYSSTPINMTRSLRKPNRHQQSLLNVNTSVVTSNLVNHSLIENWSDEKGIMDISFNVTDLYGYDDESISNVSF